jgi:flagella basal body P-ring formation protein FlgA
MEQTGDLIIARFDRTQSTQSIDIDSLKNTLEAAGVNLGAMNFAGAMVCKVTRSDSRLDAEMEQAIAAVQQAGATTRPAAAPIGLTASAADAGGTASGVGRSLRELITNDMSDCLSVSIESLQIHFRAEDEKLVNLAEPHFQFDVEPQKLRKLGDVTWNVTISTATGKQKVTVPANVRMWQEQLITTRPMAFRQVIGEEDVTERRVLLDRLSDYPSLGKAQVVGQQAARDLSPGTVLMGRMIEAVQMARVGQLVTVLVELNRVQVTWVAEARESGSLGQTIRVRKPATRDEFSVVLTGPQQAKLIGPAGERLGARLAART